MSQMQSPVVAVEVAKQQPVAVVVEHVEYGSGKPYKSGTFVDGKFVETEEFMMACKENVSTIERDAADMSKNHPMWAQLGQMLIGLFDAPRIGWRSVAHLLWAPGSMIGDIILPEYLPDAFTPFSTLIFQCCSDGLIESHRALHNAMVFEIMRRITATDKILVVANLIVAHPQFSYKESPEDMERLLAALWIEVMKTDEVKRLVDRIRNADESDHVRSSAYFTEFPDNCAAFFAELDGVKPSQMKACLESIETPENYVDLFADVKKDYESSDDEDDVDDDEESSADEGVVDAGVEDSKASAEDDDFAPSASETADEEPSQEDDAESERPKKKKRTKAPFPERVAGTRRSSRLVEFCVALADHDSDDDDEDDDATEEEGSESVSIAKKPEAIFANNGALRKRELDGEAINGEVAIDHQQPRQDTEIVV